MAYDEDLADRVRGVLASGPPADERKMFGGLGFMVHGSMAIAVSGQGGLMVRVDPGDDGELVARPGVRPMEMHGKPAAGWVRVDAEAVEGDDSLREWVQRGVDRAAALAD